MAQSQCVLVIDDEDTTLGAVALRMIRLGIDAFYAKDPSEAMLLAQQESERVRVAASERYDKGRVHRFAFGGGYRDLWTVEIELPVLDLAVVGDGLVPIGRFGGGGAMRWPRAIST